MGRESSNDKHDDHLPGWFSEQLFARTESKPSSYKTHSGLACKLPYILLRAAQRMYEIIWPLLIDVLNFIH